MLNHTKISEELKKSPPNIRNGTTDLFYKALQANTTLERFQTLHTRLTDSQNPITTIEGFQKALTCFNIKQ